MKCINLILLFAIFNSAYAADNIQTQILSAHNHFRKIHHASNLIWDDSLASFAKQYASYCRFQHSHYKYGENLAAGYPTISAAIQAWYSEESSYSYWFPGFS